MDISNTLIPIELQVLILKYLPLNSSLLEIRLTCTLWKDIINKFIIEPSIKRHVKWYEKQEGTKIVRKNRRFGILAKPTVSSSPKHFIYKIDFLFCIAKQITAL